MSYFDHTEKLLSQAPDLNKAKRLSKILGTNSLLKSIRNIPSSDLGYFRVGAMSLGVIFGIYTYYLYRKNYEQKISTSEYAYKLLSTNPINAGQQFWEKAHPDDPHFSRTLYYRMPKKEFNILYRMRPAYIQGFFNHEKEILIPKRKNGVEGYEIYTPFYYYTYASLDSKVAFDSSDKSINAITFEEPGAITVHRGWYFCS